MLQSTWKGFLEFYGGHSTKNSVLLSLLNQTVLHEVTDSKVVIITDSQGMSSFFVGKKTDIELALSAYFKKSMHVEFIIKQRAKKKEEPLLTYEPPIEDLFGRAGLNSKYTFENFAVSSSNNVAFAAAQAVAKDPGRSYNPLFFYGGGGVGPRHTLPKLLRAQFLKEIRKVKYCFVREISLLTSLLSQYKIRQLNSLEKNIGIFIY
jgi:chromosomal replication initiator protein